MRGFIIILLLLWGYLHCVAQPDAESSSFRRMAMLDPPTSRPVAAVLDTDTYNEIDDQYALIYALLSPELDLQAVYAAPFDGRMSTGPMDGMDKSHREILRIFELLRMPTDGVVFRGSRDFFSDRIQPERSEAVDDLLQKAADHHHDNPLYVIAVGAPTNVANAIALDSSIADKIVVVWLGGRGHDWTHQRDFNFRQDPKASALLFDSGVPLVQLPTTPVVTHLSTTLFEVEANLAGEGPVAEYLIGIFKQYQENNKRYTQDHYGWSKVLWDVAAVAWVVEPRWLPSHLVHAPIVTDQLTLSFDRSRHMMRYVYFLDRDLIYKDFFSKVKNSIE